MRGEILKKNRKRGFGCSRQRKEEENEVSKFFGCSEKKKLPLVTKRAPKVKAVERTYEKCRKCVDTENLARREKVVKIRRNFYIYLFMYKFRSQNFCRSPSQKTHKKRF